MEDRLTRCCFEVKGKDAVNAMLIAAVRHRTSLMYLVRERIERAGGRLLSIVQFDYDHRIEIHCLVPTGSELLFVLPHLPGASRSERLVEAKWRDGSK